MTARKTGCIFFIHAAATASVLATDLVSVGGPDKDNLFHAWYSQVIVKEDQVSYLHALKWVLLGLEKGLQASSAMSYGYVG